MCYQSVYVNQVFGRGLTAQSFAGYKSQRYRWAYGAMQILKRYWRDLLPSTRNRLSAGQRYHFLTGWTPWFADALQLLFTMAALYMSVLNTRPLVKVARVPLPAGEPAAPALDTVEIPASGRQAA